MDIGNPLDFTGRVVLVTGGTKGIGASIAEAFLATGADVVVCGRNAPDAPPAARGREAVFVPAHVRDPAAAAGLVDSAVERFGRLDVLVDNAGGSPDADAATVSPRSVEKIVALNLLAPFYVAQAAHRVMRARPGGRLGRQHRQCLRPRPAAGHRRVHSRQGRAAGPHQGAGPGVGARGAGQPHHHRPDPYRERRLRLRRGHGRFGGRRHSDGTDGRPGGRRPRLPVPRERPGRIRQQRRSRGARGRGVPGALSRREVGGRE